MRKDDPEVLLRYIEGKGWSVRRREKGGKELVLDCPLCGERYGNKSDGSVRRPFYVNVDTSQWNTYCCQESGNLIRLRQLLGDPPIGRAAPDPEEAARMRMLERALKAGTRPAAGGAAPTTEAAAAAVAGAVVASARASSAARPGKAGPRSAAWRRAADAAAERLWAPEGETVLAYLRGRGFGDDALRSYGVGAEHRDGMWWVVLPVRDADGSVLMIKRRSASTEVKRFEREAGGETGLFGGDVAAGEWRRAYVTEAELDAIALSQYGFSPAVAITAGAGAMPEGIREALAPFDEIVLVYDDDDAGRSGAGKAAEQLGKYRCLIVEKLPRKDAAKCLEDGVPVAAVHAAVNAAVPCVGDVAHVASFADKVRALRTATASGTPTPWSNINRLLGGGLRSPEVVVVTGDTGSGKTTWVVDMMRGVSKRVPCMVVSPEMAPEAIAAKVMTQEGGEPVRKMTDATFQSTVNAVKSLGLYVCKTRGKIPRADLRASVEYAVRRHGVRVVAVDHLDFVLEKSRDDREEQDRAVMDLVEMAIQLDICVVLVSHPRKTTIDLRTGRPRPPDLDDLYGSSAIKQLAYIVVRVHRHRDADRSAADNRAVITTLKVRHEEGEEGNEVLYFDRATLRYSLLNHAAAASAAAAP